MLRRSLKIKKMPKITMNRAVLMITSRMTPMKRPNLTSLRMVLSLTKTNQVLRAEVKKEVKTLKRIVMMMTKRGMLLTKAVVMMTMTTMMTAMTMEAMIMVRKAMKKNNSISRKSSCT